MLHLSPVRAALLALLAITSVGAVAPSGAGAAGPPGATAAGAGRPAALSPGAAAVVYLRVRARAQLPAAPRDPLALLCAPCSPVAAREATVAAGARRVAAALGHHVVAVHCRVRLTAVGIDETKGTATVRAHVITLVDWLDGRGRRDSEGDGVDHTVTLIRTGDAWSVTADDYVSDTTPLYLEKGGAPAATVHRAARRLERSAGSAPLVLPAAPSAAAPGASLLSGDPTPRPDGSLGYVATLTYDRDAAKAYADKYALSYNPTYVHFSADCANFGSQVMLAGGYPGFGSSYDSGWWYDKQGTSSPSDDSYSHAWIAVVNQRGAWTGKYANIVTSIGDTYRGDFVYYDWTGDGVWDHVAEFAGTNSAGQKVVDAHSTDHYHVYWKLGTSATHYGFLHTRPSVVV